MGEKQGRALHSEILGGDCGRARPEDRGGGRSWDRVNG